MSQPTKKTSKSTKPESVSALTATSFLLSSQKMVVNHTSWFIGKEKSINTQQTTELVAVLPGTQVLSHIALTMLWTSALPSGA